jgi:hypothetical protein
MNDRRNIKYEHLVHTIHVNRVLFEVAQLSVAQPIL